MKNFPGGGGGGKDLTLGMLGKFSCFCCHLLTFFRINLYRKFFQERYQSVMILGPDLLVLIWVQIVCKRLSADNKSL